MWLRTLKPLPPSSRCVGERNTARGSSLRGASAGFYFDSLKPIYWKRVGVHGRAPADSRAIQKALGGISFGMFETPRALCRWDPMKSLRFKEPWHELTYRLVVALLFQTATQHLVYGSQISS